MKRLISCWAVAFGLAAGLIMSTGGNALACCGHCSDSAVRHKAARSSGQSDALETHEHAHARCCWHLGSVGSREKHANNCWGALFSSTKVEVEKTNEGIVLKISSDDPEVRARLQKSWGNFATTMAKGRSVCLCPHCAAHGEDKADGSAYTCPWCPHQMHVQTND